jgi:hypothetical protein
MHGDLSTTQGDNSRAFERRKEAAGALARRAGEVRDLGLRRADEHVLLRCAVGLARDRLGEQRARHAAGHGLERLLEQSLVRAAHPLGEAGEQLQRDVGIAGDQPLDVGGEERHGGRGLDRLGGGGARLPAEHRQLAEEHARAQLREGHHAPVLVLAREHHRARSQQVAGVPNVALAEDHLALLPVARHGHLSHLVQLAVLEVAEDLGVGKKASRVLPGGHEAHNPTLSGRRT